MTSSNPNDLPKIPSPSTITWVGRVSTYEFVGGKAQTFSPYQIILYEFFYVLLLWHKVTLLALIHVAAGSYSLLHCERSCHRSSPPGALGHTCLFSTQDPRFGILGCADSGTEHGKITLWLRLFLSLFQNCLRCSGPW